jgi:hypothetical protein
MERDVAIECTTRPPHQPPANLIRAVINGSLDGEGDSLCRLVPQPSIHKNLGLLADLLHTNWDGDDVGGVRNHWLRHWLNGLSLPLPLSLQTLVALFSVDWLSALCFAHDLS